MHFLTKLLAASLVLPACAVAAPASNHMVAGEIAGPDGAWDYASFDPATGQLFVSRGTSITVIDPQHPMTVRSLGHLAHGHAALAIAGNRLLATSGADGKVLIIDRTTGAQKALSVGLDPDAALIEAGSRRAWVMVAKSGKAVEIDIDAAKVVRTIAFAPGLEYPAIVDKTLYVNNEDTNTLYRADLVSGKAIAPIALPGCTAPSGLGYDASSHQLVSACSNGKAAIIDANSGRMTNLLSIGRAPDAVIMDVQRRLAFIPCGQDGVLDVIALGDGPAHLVEHITTEVGARTGTIDPRDGTIYLPTARFGKASKPGTRPPVLPGSFHVIVIRPR